MKNGCTEPFSNPEYEQRYKAQFSPNAQDFSIYGPDVEKEANGRMNQVAVEMHMNLALERQGAFAGGTDKSIQRAGVQNGSSRRCRVNLTTRLDPNRINITAAIARQAGTEAPIGLIKKDSTSENVHQKRTVPVAGNWGPQYPRAARALSLTHLLPCHTSFR